MHLCSACVHLCAAGVHLCAGGVHLCSAGVHLQSNTLQGGRGLGFVTGCVGALNSGASTGASSGANTGASCWWSGPHFGLICHGI